MLVAGEHLEARRAFRAHAEMDPGAALPRAGYALAAALMDDHVTAVDEMRRAFRGDPAALHPLRQDARLEPVLRTLADRNRARVKHDRGDVDAWFMIAAACFLGAQDSLGYFAVDSAIGNGDMDESAFNLKALLEAELYGALEQTEQN
jgi:hypothetical protein